MAIVKMTESGMRSSTRQVPRREIVLMSNALATAMILLLVVVVRLIVMLLIRLLLEFVPHTLLHESPMMAAIH